MKTSRFLYTVVAILVAASCSEDEMSESSVAVTGEGGLTVVATDNGFENADGSSRATTEDYATTFEEGDQMGIFVVDSDNTVEVDNLCLTLTGGSWTGSTLSYYADASYIAYFPYDSSLSGMTSEDDIVTYFTDNKLSNLTDQSTEDNYEAADLMTASVTEGVEEGGTITFVFSHKMSMIELQIPVRTFVTDDEWEYSAPLECSLDMDYTPYAYKKGTYRLIVAPDTNVPSISGTFNDGATNYSFDTSSASGTTLAAGTYTKINVTASDAGIPTDAVNRNLAAGDFFYSDGSIWPGDDEYGDNIPQDNCIGIIYSTDVPASNQEYAAGYTHGYVVALVNADGGRMGVASDSNGVDGVIWSSDGITVEGNVVAGDGENYTNHANMSAENKAEVFGRVDGYEVFSALISAGVNAAEIAQSFGTADNQPDYAAPESTTGWFLPSSGQLVEILNGLYSSESTDGFALTVDNVFTNSTDQTSKLGMINTLREIFSKISGADFLTDASDVNGRWWSSLEYDSSAAWCIEMAPSGLLYYYGADKDATGQWGTCSVRTILAF